MKNSSKYKNDIVFGSLLGDSYINKKGYLVTAHSQQQKDYLLWKMDLFSKQFNVNYGERTLINKKENKQYIQVYFYTNVTDYLKNIRNYFYKPNKTITMKQLNKLSPLGLCIWYCDDGCLSFHNKNGKIKGRQLILNTQSFTYDENIIIQQYFKEKWDINCNIHKDKNNFRIWMNGTEAFKFINIIKEHVPECMYYKICFRYFGYKNNLNLCNNVCENENPKNKCKYNII